MKKCVYFIVLIALAATANAQVFNTGQTLRKGIFDLGINPLFINGINDDNNNNNEKTNDFVMYVHSSYGITRGLDFSAKLGMGHSNWKPYIGADLEWAVLRGKPDISLSTGFHIWNDPALDLTFNTSFLITPFQNLYSFCIYGGFDMDIILNDIQDYPTWLFIGTEIFYVQDMSFMLETELGLNDIASNIFGIGVNIYFR